MADVKEFAHQYQLEEILPLLEKGALVAQSPDDYETIPELDEADRIALKNEVEHKWSHPAKLYMTISMFHP